MRYQPIEAFGKGVLLTSHIAFLPKILIEIDEQSDWTSEVQMAERIVCEAMQELNGTIPISCSFALSRFWSKDAKSVYDAKGQISVWNPEECGGASQAAGGGETQGWGSPKYTS